MDVSDPATRACRAVAAQINADPAIREAFPDGAQALPSWAETSSELDAYARRNLRRRAVSLTITADAGSFVHGQAVDLDITGAPDLNGVWTVADVRPEDGDYGVTFGRVRVYLMRDVEPSEAGAHDR